MASITLTNTLRGDIDGILKSVSQTYTQQVSSGAESSVQVGANWLPILSVGQTSPAGGQALVVLINEGPSDAIYRIFDGTDYYRMNLPSGSAVPIHLAYDKAYGGVAGTTKALAVYSASGTRVRIGIFT